MKSLKKGESRVMALRTRLSIRSPINRHPIGGQGITFGAASGPGKHRRCRERLFA